MNMKNECIRLTQERRQNDIDETISCYKQNLITLQDVRTVLKVFLRVTNLQYLGNDLTDYEVMRASIEMTDQLIHES